MRRPVDHAGVLAALVSLFLLTGCGSDGDDGQDGATGSQDEAGAPDPAEQDGDAGSDGDTGTQDPEGETGAQEPDPEGDSGDQDPAGENDEPSGPTISNISTVGSPIEPGGQVQAFVTAESSSGESLTYTWDIPEGWDGTDSGTDTQVITAPEEQAVLDTLNVTVSDGERSTSASVQLATRGPAIESFSTSFDAPASAGDPVSFSVDAFNRDGQELRYHYAISGVRYDDRGAQWTWTATHSMGGRYRVEGIVEDVEGLTATASLQATLAGVSAWPGFGGDRHRTGRTSSPDAHGAVGTEKWSFDTGTGMDTSPAVGADGTVYVASDDGVYALDPEDGSDNWHFRPDGAADSRVWSSPALGADGTVYVGANDGNVYALHPADGSEVWSFETGDWVTSSPMPGADGTVYVGSWDGKVYALNAADGDEKWSFTTGSEIRSSPTLGADGTVYVGSYDNSVYALDPADGSEIWRFETGGTVPSPPAVAADGTVYVGSRDNHVYALDPADGSEVWSFETNDDVISSPALGADGTVYVGSDRVYALDPADGSEIWSFDDSETFFSDFRSSPAVGADGTVYVGANDGFVYALDPADGSEIWSFETGAPVFSSPALGADGTVYVGSLSGNVYAIE